ncbi:SAICAR synthase-like protein [Russula compacta]|nr:SAICAR synthase-like protein [Russula compacta]
MADDESADPSPTELQPLAYQVGGHGGIQVTGDGALIVKPALPLELQFYQNDLPSPALASLRRWVPTYLGMLRLEGQNTSEGLASVEGVPESEKDEYPLILVVLENVAHGFRKPNILDIKLGTVLYDEDTPPRKRERMQEAARRTTSGQVGIRLTGFQVFGNKTSQPLVVPKNYGKSICTAELPAGIARFFPGQPYLAPVRLSYSDHTLSGLPGAHPGGRLDVGLPGTLLVPILRFIRQSVQELRDVLSSIELRLVGSSLLMVYEGDWDRAEVGVEWLAEHAERRIDDDDEWKEGEIWEDHEGDCPCVVRLIDFAHTRLRPGQGPDPGVLKALDTILGLLDGRIASVTMTSFRT